MSNAEPTPEADTGRARAPVDGVGDPGATAGGSADAGIAIASGAADAAGELSELRALGPAAVELVREWLRRAEGVPADDAAERLAGVLRDPAGLEFAVGFVDGVVRPEDVRVAAKNLRQLAAKSPEFLPWHLRRALEVGGGAAPAAPRVVVPIARRVLRDMVGHLVVDATPRRLGAAIAAIGGDGTRLNINLLGEAVLGAREGSRRLDGTIELLRRDDVDYVSIKTSSTVAPHQPWGFEAAADEIVDQLVPLYRVAAASPTPKFINLDMEEYRDLELTLEVFTRILNRDEFLGLSAGIALQAYIPDAHGAMERLQHWAARRVAAGGAPIKLRLVKGANLPMERVEADLRGWPLATMGSKRETDTNYKRMLAWSLTPERTRNVRVGVAGHNLFDIAFAWLLAKRRGVEAAVDFEMLLGMAHRQAEVVRRDVGELLLYTPVVQPAEFDVAIAYLVRRLEEGASDENFMSAVFDLDQDEALFARERDRFLASLDALTLDAPPPNRGQDRNRVDDGHGGRDQPLVSDPTTTARTGVADGETSADAGFVSTPDSDPSLLANQRWAAGIRERARDSRLGLEMVAANTVGDANELAARIRIALDADRDWRDLAGAERAEVLHRAGAMLERRRAELIEIAIAEAGKTFDQADPEVSEAVDFAHWYAELARALDEVDGAIATPARLIAVTPPWNFPIAIPAGSTLAALASGASVIVKPARLAARCAAVMVEALWTAGVPRGALQFVQFADRELQSRLVAAPAVERVILTGGFETAEAFRALRPDLQLFAETSGKNAIVVTPSADYDLAVRDVVASAFGHAGQKCSAASLVVLVGQAGRSKRIRNQLRDAVTSLRVGWPTEAASQMGPIIAPASGKLLEGLTELGAGEGWFVPPRRLDDEGRLWRPGVRTGVRHGGAFHRVEYFGPVLGVITVQTLEEAIEIVNGVDYGLTSGLHSLDPAEIARWCASVQAGNLYVNRGITGAIVQRQPFGGWKKSAVGATAKAGGPNYLVGLVDWAAAPANAAAGTEPSLSAVRGLRDAARALAAEPARRPASAGGPGTPGDPDAGTTGGTVTREAAGAGDPDAGSARGTVAREAADAGDPDAGSARGNVAREAADAGDPDAGSARGTVAREAADAGSPEDTVARAGAGGSEGLVPRAGAGSPEGMVHRAARSDGAVRVGGSEGTVREDGVEGTVPRDDARTAGKSVAANPSRPAGVTVVRVLNGVVERVKRTTANSAVGSADRGVPHAPKGTATRSGRGSAVRGAPYAPQRAERVVTSVEAESVARGVASDEAAWTTEFGVERDVQGLAAERNVFRYLPAPGHVTVRLAEGGRVAHLLRAVAAGVRAGVRMRVSTGVRLPSTARAAIAAAGVACVFDTDLVFATQATRFPSGRIRLIDGDRSALARTIGGRCDLKVYAQPVTESGRIELLPFLLEQSVSITAHRFGTPNASVRHVLPGDAAPRV